MFLRKQKRHQRPSIEEQLATLEGCGIRLRADRSVDELLKSFPREQYESSPYELLLVALGEEVEEAPRGRYYSDDVYYIDTECIEDHGSYARIVERFSAIAGDALPIENIRDYVDIDEGEVWLEFELDGETLRYEPRVDSDWIDPEFVGWMCAVLRRRGTDRRFTFLDLKGQDFVTGCTTPRGLKKLRRLTGLDIRWLDE